MTLRTREVEEQPAGGPQQGLHQQDVGQGRTGALLLEGQETDGGRKRETHAPSVVMPDPPDFGRKTEIPVLLPPKPRAAGAKGRQSQTHGRTRQGGSRPLEMKPNATEENQGGTDMMKDMLIIAGGAVAAMLVVFALIVTLHLTTPARFQEVAKQHIRDNPREVAMAIARGAFQDTGRHDELVKEAELYLRTNPAATECQTDHRMDDSLQAVECRVSLELTKQEVTLRGTLTVGIQRKRDLLGHTGAGDVLSITLDPQGLTGQGW